MCFFLLLSFIFSINTFPAIKFTKRGIFGWYKFLNKLKKPFNNSQFFGMTINTSSPDLSMIVHDIVKNHMKLHDLHISQKINEAMNRSSITIDGPQILSSMECDNSNKNVCQFEKFTKIKLNLESIGVTQEHSNIFVGNLAGCMSPTIYLLCLAALTVLYYIIQIILSFFYFKPSKTNRPKIHSIFLFYLGIALIISSSGLYFYSYRGINSFYTTFYNFDTIYPVIMSSLSDSLTNITHIGLPNALGPINIITNVTNQTHYYIKNTSESFLFPTIEILEKLASTNESHLGVFTIYNEKIRPASDEFYSRAKKYPKLKDLPIFFNETDFSSVQNTIQNLLISEIEFTNRIEKIDSFFQYFNSTLHPYKEYVINLTNQRIKGRSETVGDIIMKIQNETLERSKPFFRIEQFTKNDASTYNSIRVLFFVLGGLLVFFAVFYSVVYMMHNNVSLCVANTISVFPIIATVLVCFLDFVFSSVGYTDYCLSEQLEVTLDNFLSDMIEMLIPTREIVFTPINLSFYTNGEFNGILNLSTIYFPKKMTNVKHFFESDERTGIIDAFQLQNIVNMSLYGDEIGNFMIFLGKNFSLSEKTMKVLDEIHDLLSMANLFPRSIDGLFNWGIPILISTDELRFQIKKMDPNALIELDQFLNEIDTYSKLMDIQWKTVISLISNNVTTSFDMINIRLQNFTRMVTGNLGLAVKEMCRDVYPVLNEITCEAWVGPYALVRNALFYDISNSSAFISLAGVLMMIGFPFIVTLMWIRRKGMKATNYMERKNTEINLQQIEHDLDRNEEVQNQPSLRDDCQNSLSNVDETQNHNENHLVVHRSVL